MPLPSVAGSSLGKEHCPDQEGLYHRASILSTPSLPAETATQVSLGQDRSQPFSLYWGLESTLNSTSGKSETPP